MFAQPVSIVLAYECCLLYCLYRSAEGVKENIIASEDKFYQYCNKVFGSWDFALSDVKNVVLKKKSLFNEITVSIAEVKTLCQLPYAFVVQSNIFVFNIFCFKLICYQHPSNSSKYIGTREWYGSCPLCEEIPGQLIIERTS